MSGKKVSLKKRCQMFAIWIILIVGSSSGILCDSRFAICKKLFTRCIVWIFFVSYYVSKRGKLTRENSKKINSDRIFPNTLIGEQNLFKRKKIIKLILAESLECKQMKLMGQK
ncbi:hypothetical protein BpHYR1_039148 [Brachionus plicatilis]|uniref:Uncharacterized protein n=1 Tax=Brachionus plicatilis TaxID=10195 RepID=A0A3M7RJM4_BRAPC|nr:hypothetical protein BpHYR1_039148 [Brachionus plicatilis]